MTTFTDNNNSSSASTPNDSRLSDDFGEDGNPILSEANEANAINEKNEKQENNANNGRENSPNTDWANGNGEDAATRSNSADDESMPRMTQKIKELETNATAAQARIRELESTLQAFSGMPNMDGTPQDFETGAALTPPNKDDYVDAKDYIDAVLTYQRKASQAQREQQRQAQAQQVWEKTLNRFEEREAAAREKHADYDQVAHAEFPVTEVMGHVLMQSEQGAELLYWLGKNPQESRRIAQLSQENPLRAAQELGRLEASTLTPRKWQSSAPPPLSASRGTTTSNDTGRTPDSMSISQLQTYLKTR